MIKEILSFKGSILVLLLLLLADGAILPNIIRASQPVNQQELLNDDALFGVPVRVVAVVDGDTFIGGWSKNDTNIITVDDKMIANLSECMLLNCNRVRIAYLQTPESNKECFATEASSIAFNLLSNQFVWLLKKCDGCRTRDTEGRILASTYLDFKHDLEFSSVAIAQGYGKVYVGSPELAGISPSELEDLNLEIQNRIDRLKELQNKAKEINVGRWKECID